MMKRVISVAGIGWGPSGRRELLKCGATLLLGGATIFSSGGALAAPSCARELTADVVAIDQPLMFNRLGAQNINGMIYALKRDVINRVSGKPLSMGGEALRGEVVLRPDKRPRPLVLRLAAGDCLTVNLTNLLTDNANPRKDEVIDALKIDEQVADRHVSFTVQGMQVVDSVASTGDFAGRNAKNLADVGETRTYRLYAEHEGVHVVTSYGATFGSEGTQGNTANGLFGQVVVLPKGSRVYKSTVTNEELRLASGGQTTVSGQPKVNYEARYPMTEPWISEGKAGVPVLNLIDGNEIVAAEMDALVMGPNADGTYPPSTYPLESTGKRNPNYPNRLEPFRDFSVAFHDEVAAAQAFPGFWNDPVFGYVLDDTRDAFMINYGSGGIGAEIVANRLGVGPMHDCLSCAYEEFFLTAHVIGDPAMLVDIPANAGLENLAPGQAPPPGTTGVKATRAFYPADPSNVHHSYTGDFVKIRNTHVGKEQHIFHLHNHQWLFNPNDDNSNYIDAQGIGPGSGYTYEIAFGGSGNRNKTAGDAIYHCHFYPHFAQGMWYLWRVHDVFEAGTELAVSQAGGGVHQTPWALQDGTPAVGARALPDGEVIVGTPIPAIVPLPGKAMAPMPGKVTVVPKVAGGEIVGSVAKVDRSKSNYNKDGTLKNPGFPFWIGGAESTIGQRPPTPPLDMLDPVKAAALKASGKALWAKIDAAQAGGFDGGLPRHALDGVKAGGKALGTVSAVDFSKVIQKAKPVYFPEEGTDVEQAAMAFHAKRSHPSTALRPDGTAFAANFIANGNLPVAGAPYNEPCIDDTGRRLETGVQGTFFSGGAPGEMKFFGASAFSADKPRTYKGANFQFDAVFNKVGYHYPQERMIALWEDVVPIVSKQKPPEPLVMRMNTFDCTMYQHTNLVPEVFEYDDYQVRTPTDIIGQHIHLPKWDLTTADGSANGWNYEDGTLSPGAVRERIHAINAYNKERVALRLAPVKTLDGKTYLEEKAHPFFGQFGRADWLGARTTLQRWFADPVINVHKIDRGLGNIFTHDHYGPSTHQQIGLYATVLTEPAGSTWKHAETGEQMYTRPDGGPTSWQAAIITGDINGDNRNDSYREFFLEYTDFQHAYESGVYVGAGPDGKPNPTLYPATPDSFRFAISPPVREQAYGDDGTIFPDLVVNAAAGINPGCPKRPCPQAISGDDPGLFTVNYRNEPLALRIYDPQRIGPDGKPGMQAEGPAGDLAFALQTRTDRAIPWLNLAPSAISAVPGVMAPNSPTTTTTTGGKKGAKPTTATNTLPTILAETSFPPHINRAGDLPGDPFTPMLRTYSGDKVRLRVQAGGDEEEHNITLHGVKWLQSGSSHGSAPHSGWRNAQAAGISEQFTFAAPVFMAPDARDVPAADYLYSIDASMEGYWSGVWGVMRNYSFLRDDLFALPNNLKPVTLRNTNAFNGVCPNDGPDGLPTPQRKIDVVVALANDILGNPLGLTIAPANVEAHHVGGSLNADGGTLVYNSRPMVIPQKPIVNHETGAIETVGGQAGPLHDPTAVMWVRKEDLDPTTGKLKPDVPVEPLVLRAAAGECVKVTLENRLPTAMPDLPSFAVTMGVVNRDRFNARGVTTFNNNLMRPSSQAGMHAQLLSYDVLKSDGTNVGINPVQTVAPRASASEPYPTRTYEFYAGDLRLQEAASAVSALRNSDNVQAMPVEFGGFNLMPADKIKQPQKALAGAMIVEPMGATWVEDAGMRAAATVTGVEEVITMDQDTGVSTVVLQPRAPYRDFALVWQRALNHRWADGSPVENTAGEGPGMPEDPQDNSGVAINYKVEPLWYRFGMAPDSPFGRADGGGLGDVSNAHMAYSNELVGADPQTPVLKVPAGSPFRMHVTMPAGGSRNVTFGLNGHQWARDPYVAEKVDALGFPLKNPGVGSVRIGDNPMAMYLSGQENILPAAHFSFVFPSAGGAFAVPGDYLYRDMAGFGNLNGFWGIVRVEEPGSSAAQ